MSTTTTTPTPIRLGLRENLAQFSLLVGVNALVGGMIGQERTVLPLLAEDEFGLTKFTAADLHRRLRDRQGGHQLLRRHPVGPLRPQTGARRRLARRPARAAAVDVGADVGLGGVRQRARRQPGPGLVDDGDHEDRPRRPGQARPGDGPQRGRRLRRRRDHRPRHRLHRRAARLRPAPFFLGLAYAGLGLGISACSSARPAATPATRPPTTSPPTTPSTTSSTGEIFTLTSFARRRCRRAHRRARQQPQRRPRLGSVPDLLRRRRPLSVGRIGVLAAIYPGVWGLGQLVTGALSDRIGRKPLIAGGCSPKPRRSA